MVFLYSKLLNIYILIPKKPTNTKYIYIFQANEHFRLIVETLTVHLGSLVAASVCGLQRGSHKSRDSGLLGTASCLPLQFPTW